MFELKAREPVVFAEDFYKLVDWYENALGFEAVLLAEDDYHYCNLENEHGVRVGIADAAEMGVQPGDRRGNTVVLQFEVPDVKAFFTHLESVGGVPTFGPSFDEKGQFWYGGFQDIEGNPIWVVDVNCP